MVDADGKDGDVWASSLLMDDGAENVQVRCYDGSGRVLTTTQVKPTSAAEMAVGEGQQ